MLHVVTLSRSLLEIWCETSVQQLEAMGSMAKRGEERNVNSHSLPNTGLALILKTLEKQNVNPLKQEANTYWGLRTCRLQGRTRLYPTELTLYWGRGDKTKHKQRHKTRQELRNSFRWCYWGCNRTCSLRGEVNKVSRELRREQPHGSLEQVWNGPTREVLNWIFKDLDGRRKMEKTCPGQRKCMVKSSEIGKPRAHLENREKWTTWCELSGWEAD